MFRYRKNWAANGRTPSVNHSVNGYYDGAYALGNFEIATTEWDPIVIYLVTQRLTPESLQLWEQRMAGRERLPT